MKEIPGLTLSSIRSPSWTRLRENSDTHKLSESYPLIIMVWIWVHGISGHKHGCPSRCSIPFTGLCYLLLCIVQECRDCNILLQSFIFPLINVSGFARFLQYYTPFSSFSLLRFVYWNWFDGRLLKIEKAHDKVVPCSFIKQRIPVDFSLWFKTMLWYRSDSWTTLQLCLWTIRYINRVQTVKLFSLPVSYEMYKTDLESKLQHIKKRFCHCVQFKANFDF